MAVTLVSSFQDLLLSATPLFTQPSFANFTTVVAGWVFCLGRHTVTNIVVASGEDHRRYTCFHRFFNRARWCLDELGHVVLGLALSFVPEGATVQLAVDDTLCRKTGRHIWGAAMHHDQLRSTASRPAFSFGHSWVVLSIVIMLPSITDRPVSIPFMFRLYRKKRKKRPPGRPKGERKSTGLATEREYRTRPELAVEMLEIAAEWLAGRRARIVGDSEYSGQSISRHLPENVDLFGRMPMDAALYAEPEVRQPGQNGRPRRRGIRLPNPQEMADTRTPRWRRERVAIYGRSVLVWFKTVRALWYNSAGTRPVLVVVVRDPSRKRRDDCFFTTDTECEAIEVIETYAKRWSLEVAFRDAKQSLGFEEPQGRNRLAVSRTAPCAVVIYSLTVLWFAKSGHALRRKWFEKRPWYRGKKTSSFADMLATLRQASWAEAGFFDPPQEAGSKKVAEKRILHMFASLSTAS